MFSFPYNAILGFFLTDKELSRLKCLNLQDISVAGVRITTMVSPNRPDCKTKMYQHITMCLRIAYMAVGSFNQIVILNRNIGGGRGAVTT